MVALDYLEMDAIPGATILKLDFLEPDAPDRLKAALGGPADLVLSDMAAPTTGHASDRPSQDHGPGRGRGDLRVGGVGAGRRLRLQAVPGRRGEVPARHVLKRDFAKVRHAKPEASRSDSSESYLVATGFRGGT